MKRVVFCIAAAATLSGCAGTMDYKQPVSGPIQDQPEKVINRPLEAVWADAVPVLGTQTFVISNADKASGLVNIGYSGKPGTYVDCGRITSKVKMGGAERVYDFAAADAHQQYRTVIGNGVYEARRDMALEGRVNVVFRALTQDKTRVSVNTQYVLRRDVSVQPIEGWGQPGRSTDSITFSTKSMGAYPVVSETGRPTECVATGQLESEILKLIN